MFCFFFLCHFCVYDKNKTAHGAELRRRAKRLPNEILTEIFFFFYVKSNESRKARVRVHVGTRFKKPFFGFYLTSRERIFRSKPRTATNGNQTIPNRIGCHNRGNNTVVRVGLARFDSGTFGVVPDRVVGVFFFARLSGLNLRCDAYNSSGVRLAAELARNRVIFVGLSLFTPGCRAIPAPFEPLTHPKPRPITSTAKSPLYFRRAPLVTRPLATAF